MAKNLSVNSGRLWQRLMDMAKIGATEAGGCNRQALTVEDAAGRALFTSWCEDAGCTVRLDAVGNVFVRREGAEADAPVVMAGSHLDTQPTGGKFDGVYGVLAGLEVIETLNDHGVQTRHPLEVVVWTNEEGARFDCAMMGSAVWSGVIELDTAYALRDLHGVSVKQELERLDQLGSTLDRKPTHAAFELHIEQGPILEDSANEIGVVTGVQHMCRYRISFHGQETHAGPSPMSLRRDPMMAVSESLPKLYSLSDQYAPGARITFGYIKAEPGSPNTVPGVVEFTVDMRNPDEELFKCMQSGLEEIITSAAKLKGVDVHCERVWEAAGVEFDEDCISAVRNAVERRGYSAIEMISGAGHDACNVSKVAPVSMIFVPCEGGLSHNEAENIEPIQAERGANVLLDAMIERADVVS